MVSGNGDVVPQNGKHLPYGFPDSVVKRALVYCQESESVALGHRRLRAELELGGMPCPEYETVWMWVKQSKECYEAVTGPKKREMVAISEDVASEAAGRMIRALPGLSDSQIPVAYGIAMQRRTDWDKVGQAGNVQAVQINITDSKGESIGQFGPPGQAVNSTDNPPAQDSR